MVVTSIDCHPALRGASCHKQMAHIRVQISDRMRGPSGNRQVVKSSIPTVYGRAEARPVTISTVCDHAEARPVTRKGHTDAEPTHTTTCTLTKPAGLALYFARSVALPSAARPVTVNRLTDNKLAGRLRRPLTWPAGPALQAAPRGAMPPEARPVTGKWLTERGLAAYITRDRDRNRNTV